MKDLIRCLCSLHNFTIECNNETNLPSATGDDSVRLHLNGSFSAVGTMRYELGNEWIKVPLELLNGGEHTDDHVRPRQLRHDELLPREQLLRLIEDGDFRRPEPN